jgi:hypothetical protein
MKTLCSILFLVVTAAAANAQQTGITGKVTDPTGAVIAGASVDVKQAAGAEFKATTNGAGIYIVPSLLASDYTVTVAAKGFATVEQKLTILVGQMVEADIKLPLATTTTSVVVESSAIEVDTTSSQVAGNITPEEVRDLPVNGRSYVELSSLVAGIKGNAFGNARFPGLEALQKGRRNR